MMQTDNTNQLPAHMEYFKPAHRLKEFPDALCMVAGVNWDGSALNVLFISGANFWFQRKDFNALYEPIPEETNTD